MDALESNAEYALINPRTRKITHRLPAKKVFDAIVESAFKNVTIFEIRFFYCRIEKSRIYNDFFNVQSLNESLVRLFQYKLEHLLRMGDRNSMAFSIEARVPYLDYRLV